MTGPDVPEHHAPRSADGTTTESETDHRRRPRRRGDALNAAILDATLAELAEVGYRELTMESVAERARASKASLYRRWDSKVALALDAAYSVLPAPEEIADTGHLRGDLLAMLHDINSRLAGPAGQAMLGLMGDALAHPERADEVRKYARGSGVRTAREILRRAAARGEVDLATVTDRRLETGQALMRYHAIATGLPVRAEIISGIVDEVLLPLFRDARTAPHDAQ